jgi:hypothetical protein
MKERIGKRYFVLGLVVTLLGAASLPAGADVGEVRFHQKISDDTGGFEGGIDPGDRFGSSVDGLGDLDGDGTPDLVVGVPGTDGLVGEDEGSVWFLFLDPDGRVDGEKQFAPGTGPLAAAGNALGSDVATLGDLDGDGHTEVAVGAPFHDETTAQDRGIVWTLFLDDDGDVEAVQRFDGFESDFDGDLDAGDFFGDATAALGDLDGDGVPDLAVGAPGDDDDGFERGAIWILFLDEDGLVKSQEKISSDSGDFAGDLSDEDRFGSSIAALGDLDGDGVTDLAVGAPDDDDGDGENLGAVWILFMNDDGTVKGEYKISKADDHLLASLDENDNFGWDVGALGDLDGDDVPDLGVATPGDDDGSGSNRGAMYVLFLNADGSVKSEVKISDSAGNFEGNLDQLDRFGSAVAALGDLDGDGTTEIACSAPFNDDGAGSDNGAVFVLFIEGLTVLCGDADSNDQITSTDALLTLNAAVGSTVCEACVCDVNSSGAITAVDAQILLSAAVGLPPEPVCPVCE